MKEPTRGPLGHETLIRDQHPSQDGGDPARQRQMSALHEVGAIVVAQEAAPAMKAAGFGTMIVTGGGFADHPIPALATVSLGKAAFGRLQRCSASI